MIFDFIKKYFPVKANSLDEFIDIAEREKAVSVVAEPKKKPIDVFFTAPGSAMVEYKYSARFEAKTPAGRSIIFNEIYESKAEIKDGILEHYSRGVFALTGLFTIDNRLEKIKKRLPNIKTALNPPRGKMYETARKRMYEDARRFNITSLNIQH